MIKFKTKWHVNIIYYNIITMNNDNLKFRYKNVGWRIFENCSNLKTISVCKDTILDSGWKDQTFGLKVIKYNKGEQPE